MFDRLLSEKLKRNAAILLRFDELDLRAGRYEGRDTVCSPLHGG